ncbi:MAG TPA: hypothetical protein VHQ99_03645 [Gaiellaceae bacterium]|nr:hypothetical protein [Gaiellaceae bacterium]
MAANEPQPKPGSPEPLRHVAPVDETQLEHAELPAAANGQRARVESPHDSAPDAEDDHHAYSHPYPDVLQTERPRGEKGKRRVIAWCGQP